MESVGKKPRRHRRAFKAEIVELCQRGDRSVGQVARDFDLTETAVREWVKQAERNAGTRQDGGLTSAGHKELAQLRAENRRLREDVEILKRATAFFAEELTAAGGNVPAALAAWERRQLALGHDLLARCRAIGDSSQFLGTFRPGDPRLIFGLYGPVIS
jgi:transposase